MSLILDFETLQNITDFVQRRAITLLTMEAIASVALFWHLGQVLGLYAPPKESYDFHNVPWKCPLQKWPCPV